MNILELLKRSRELIASDYIQPMPEGHMECLDCRSNLSGWPHDDKCPTGMLLTDLDSAIAGMKDVPALEARVARLKKNEIELLTKAAQRFGDGKYNACVGFRTYDGYESWTVLNPMKKPFNSLTAAQLFADSVVIRRGK